MTWTLTVLVNDPKGGTASADRYSGSATSADSNLTASDTVRIESRPKTACGWRHVSWREETTSSRFGQSLPSIRTWPALINRAISGYNDEHIDIVMTANFSFQGNDLIMTEPGRTKILTGSIDHSKILAHR